MIDLDQMYKIVRLAVGLWGHATVTAETLSHTALCIYSPWGQGAIPSRDPDQGRRYRSEAEAGGAEVVRISQGRVLRRLGLCRMIVSETSSVPLGCSVGLWMP